MNTRTGHSRLDLKFDAKQRQKVRPSGLVEQLQIAGSTLTEHACARTFAANVGRTEGSGGSIYEAETTLVEVAYASGSRGAVYPPLRPRPLSVSQRVRNSMDDGHYRPQKKPRICQRCRTHGTEQLSTSEHRLGCPFRHCECAKCQIIQRENLRHSEYNRRRRAERRAQQFSAAASAAAVHTGSPSASHLFYYVSSDGNNALPVAAPSAPYIPQAPSAVPSRSHPYSWESVVALQQSNQSFQHNMGMPGTPPTLIQSSSSAHLHPAHLTPSSYMSSPLLTSTAQPSSSRRIQDRSDRRSSIVIDEPAPKRSKDVDERSLDEGGKLFFFTPFSVFITVSTDCPKSHLHCEEAVNWAPIFCPQRRVSFHMLAAMFPFSRQMQIQAKKKP